MIQQANCGSKITVCIRQQLVALYLIWIAATGLSLKFAIIPGSQTLQQFHRTQCTTVQVSRSGENSCTFCLQIYVVTTDTPSAQRQLQQDEVIKDSWVR